MELPGSSNTDKLSDMLHPDACSSTNLPIDIITEIDSINWTSFSTAYGTAEKTIPFYLKNLFCVDDKIAMNATHQLWCSLCHQHAYISTAALPAYDVLKTGLLQLSDKIKIEILDIFLGFATCTSKIYFDQQGSAPADWEIKMQQKLINDKPVFQKLSFHTDKEISSFANAICTHLRDR
ncbi:hypothetical protein ACTHGU_05180 [Chitinophagaceae bacterium MMS25-I14]